MKINKITKKYSLKISYIFFLRTENIKQFLAVKYDFCVFCFRKYKIVLKNSYPIDLKCLVKFKKHFKNFEKKINDNIF